jgi:hypothetical protein
MERSASRANRPRAPRMEDQIARVEARPAEVGIDDTDPVIETLEDMAAP